MSSCINFNYNKGLKGKIKFVFLLSIESPDVLENYIFMLQGQLDIKIYIILFHISIIIIFIFL